MLRCEHTWPATPEHVRDARTRVTELASRAGAPRALLERVRLAVTEAVSNVVVHGYRGTAPGPVTVIAEAEDHRLRVVVRDDGCGLASRPENPGAGLGLPLIAEAAESVCFRTGQDGHGTVLAMTFVLPVAIAG